MKNVKFIVTAILLLFLTNQSFAQSPPAELIGKWKITSITAQDTLGNPTPESQGLHEDCIQNNVVEYEFTDSVFTYLGNGQVVNTCTYHITEEMKIAFDSIGTIELSDLIRAPKLVSINATTLEIMSCTPDGDHVIISSTLTKQ